MVPGEAHVASPGINYLQPMVIESGSSNYKAWRWQSLGIRCPQASHRASGGRRWICSPDLSFRKSRLYTLCSYISIFFYVTSAHLGWQDWVGAAIGRRSG